MSKLDEMTKFVTVWQSANDLDELAKKLGKSKAALQQTARSLRKNGVNLKKFGASTEKLSEDDYKKLAQIVK